jgi:hypothetical protein
VPRDPDPAGSHRLSVTPPRVRVAAVLVTAAVASIAAGCSSSPAASRSTTTTTGHRAVPATSSTTTTTTQPPATTTTTGIPTSTVKITITGASASIQFVSSSISGSLSPGTGSFGQGGTVYSFPVTGVQYSGAPTTASATGGLITSVSVTAAPGGGVSVTVNLSSPTSHASLGLGHDEVAVEFS